MAKPRKFGPFEVLDRLGSGGMGIVYRAVYTKTGQTVALKVLSPDASGDAQVQQRFDREMDILKRLDHKNIVKYYGGGKLGNQRFYAMELMDGGSLDDALKKRSKLSWEQAIDVGKAVAQALEHAHYYGIIHRDLKPANLFLSKEGRLKLGDFGIARDTERTALTAAGKTVGTYAYMAPEQISGKPPVSRKTDQYALGCVLFELLTGKPPFEAENPASMLMQHLEVKPPRLRSMAPECPVWLEKVVERLLEKEPDDRFYDAKAVYVALEDVRKKEAAGAGVAQRTAVGDATVAATANDPELRKLLRRKKKKRRKGSEPFYQRAWFLATCLALLIGGVVWAAWPLNDAERLDRGLALMSQAAELDEEDADRALLMLDAEKHFEKIVSRSPDGPQAEEAQAQLLIIETDRLRRQVEMRIARNRNPRNTAEGLYMDARRAENDGDRLSALVQYRRLMKLVEIEEKYRPYRKLADRRIANIYREGSGENDARDLVEMNLQRAETHFEKGETVEADRIWNAIVDAFGDNRELAPLIQRARDRLSGKKVLSSNP